MPESDRGTSPNQPMITPDQIQKIKALLKEANTFYDEPIGQLTLAEAQDLIEELEKVAQKYR